MGEAVLQVGRDRHIDRTDDHLGVLQRLARRQGPVLLALRRGKPAAGGRERGEPEPDQQPGGADVPGVRQQQRAVSVVLVEKSARHRTVRRHAATVTSDQPVG